MKKVNSILLSLILVACFSSEVFAGTYKAYVSKKVPSEALIYENFNSASFKSVVFAKYYGLYKKADNTEPLAETHETTLRTLYIA